MRLLPNTAFEFRFWVGKSIIDTAETNPHVGEEGLVEDDFDVFAAKPGASSFATVSASDYAITEIGRGWYKAIISALTDFIDTTTGPGTISIDYAPAILPDGYASGPVWEKEYNVGYDPGDTFRWNGSAVSTPDAAGVPRVNVHHWRNGLPDALVTVGSTVLVPSNVQGWKGTAPDNLVSGRVDVSVGNMQNNTMTAAAAAADLTTELQTGLATAANLALVQADVDDVQSRLPAALDGGRMNSVTNAMGANVITAAATAADFGTEVATAVWNFVTEGTHTAVEVFRGMTSVIMGKLAISGNTRTYRDLDDTKDRVEAEVTSAGRTSVDYVDLAP